MTQFTPTIKFKPAAGLYHIHSTVFTPSVAIFPSWCLHSACIASWSHFYEYYGREMKRQMIYLSSTKHFFFSTQSIPKLESGFAVTVLEKTILASSRTSSDFISTYYTIFFLISKRQTDIGEI